MAPDARPDHGAGQPPGRRRPRKWTGASSRGGVDWTDDREAASPIAGRPYDLRHGGVSLWLNAGVPATDVAARAGHTVAVLLRVYAKCVDGRSDEINRRIDAALGEPNAEGTKPS